MHTQESQGEIYLHRMPDGKLWASSPQPAHGWTPCDDSIVSASQLAGMTVKVIGTADNAELLYRLYNLKLSAGSPRKIQIASPSICFEEGDDDKPSLGFVLERVHDRAPSVGGWHTMTRADYSTYALIRAMKGRDQLNDHAALIFRGHPAFQAFSFIATVDLNAAARLVCQWVDPRWHVHPSRPNRMSQLKSFFYMEPDVAPYVIDTWLNEVSMDDRGDAYSRPALLLKTWAENGLALRLEPECLGPRHFLQRIVTDKLCNGKCPAVAYAVATYVFLRFVRAVWLDRLTPARQYAVMPRGDGDATKRLEVKMYASECYSPTLFVPEYFFRNEDEVDAWYDHISRQ